MPGVALTLDIDGEETQDPSAAQISEAFERLKKGGGWFGPGITIATLARSETQWLMATGTRDAGFMISYQDGEAAWQYDAGPEQALPIGEVVGVFQSYARGQDWGQSNFVWERTQLFSETGVVVKRLLIITLVGVVAYVLIKRFIAE